MTNFCDRLGKARESRGICQNELAEKSGLTCSAISQLESGLRKPSYESLLKIANALDISCDFLVGRSELPNLYVMRVKRAANREILTRFIQVLVDMEKRDGVA